MKAKFYLILIAFSVFQLSLSGQPGRTFINIDSKNQLLVFGNSRLTITLDYNRKCNISCMEVNGQKVVESISGIFSRIKTGNKTFSTLQLDSSPEVETGSTTVKVKNIRYGEDDSRIFENWIFNISDNDIIFKIII